MQNDFAQGFVTLCVLKRETLQGNEANDNVFSLSNFIVYILYGVVRVALAQ